LILIHARSDGLKMLFRALLFIVVTCLPAWAALPVSVDGQQLPSLAPMLEKITPAVVNIATRGQTKRRIELPIPNDPFFQRFFDLPSIERIQETQSLGSGVIVDANKGYVLTNNHVIQDAFEITITLPDGREMMAEILGRDPDTDIAVLQVHAKNLTRVPFGDSSRLRVGDFVVAIGNPFGLGQTVTSGIVSALGRSGLGIESFEDFIQTDASINLGNSGGALVNLRGELVGINTAIFGSGGGGGSIGIGFAIPINMVQDIMQQLIEHGEVKRGRLGAQGQDLTPQLAQAFDLEQSSGIIVTQIESGSPAHKAGLQVGDVIVSANGRKIRNSREMDNLVGLLRIGQTIELRLYRSSRLKKLKVVIQPIDVPIVQGARWNKKLAGAQIGEIRESSLQRGMVSYLQVVEVETGSNAWEAGIREGDIFFSINKQLIDNHEGALELIEQNKGGMILNIQRGERELYLMIK
jgi:Do/DeqQ family serine protease